MARAFTAADAKRIIAGHKDAIHHLTAVTASVDTHRNAVRTAAEALAAYEVLTVLQGIPVEELNREKQGIRIKLLRDHHYNNIADICAASAKKLAAINGISEDGAVTAKRLANAIASKTKREIKLRLSADDRNPKATALVAAIYRLRGTQQSAQQCEALLEGKKSIEAEIAALQPATGGVKWFFTSARKKDRATEAYALLTALLSGDYGQGCEEALSAANRLAKAPVSAAWEDFSRDPIPYFTLVEELTPGLLGTDNTLYGLPEDLARAIQEEPILTEGLRCTLRRYQEWGVRYILHQKRVLLGDEMGLGKTVQAIAAMVSLKNTGATHFMVICPASVITNWCREIGKHSDLRPIKLHGASRAEAFSDWTEHGGVAVTTYETTGFLRPDPSFRCALVIVDEAHYIKNPEAQRTVHTKSLCAHADRLLFMTGTALENHVDEMIELIRILQPTVASEVQKLAFLSAAPQFREKIAPVYYRRKREEVLTELPELIESKDWCTLTREEEAVYEEAVLNKRYADARRVSWNVDDLQKSSKAQRLKEIVEDAEEDGRKLIVFSFFLDTIRKAGAFLGERCLPPITGAVTPKRRQEIIDAFEAAPAGAVLLAQIQSGGTGLNIQAASVVILCEPQFKPSIENQAISRAYRMGQARNVLVHRLLCDDTVDERITQLLEQKQAIFDAFADESVTAQESLELDEKTFGTIMQEEYDRIRNK